jgi:hypothetical protein
MKEMQRQLNRMFGRARPKRKATSVVPAKLKAEAQAIGCEVQALPDGGFAVWPPASLSSDPFEGDHYANDINEARSMLRAYKAVLSGLV